MFVGVAILELHIEHARSLKDKRMVVRSLRDRLRNTFHCSVGEVAQQDLHQRARLGVAVVTTDEQSAGELLDSIARFTEEHAEAQITGWNRELVAFDATGNLGIPGIEWTAGEERSHEEDT